MSAKKSTTPDKRVETLKFTLRPNTLPNASDGNRYIGKVIPNGTMDFDDVLDRMIADGCMMGREEFRYLMNTTISAVMDEMLENPRIIDLGFCTLRPVIKGSFKYADEKFDPARHQLVIEALPSKKIKDAVATGMKLVNVTPVDIPSPRIDSVCQAPDYRRNFVSAAEPFEMHGAGLTVTCGDETAELELSSGVRVPVELKPQTKMDGSRCVRAQLAGPLPTPCPKRGKLLFRTHGLRGRSGPLVTVKSATIRLGPA